MTCFQGRLRCGQERERIRVTPRLREEDLGEAVGSLWGLGAEERRELKGGRGHDGQVGRGGTESICRL